MPFLDLNSTKYCSFSFVKGTNIDILIVEYKKCVFFFKRIRNITEKDRGSFSCTLNIKAAPQHLNHTLQILGKIFVSLCLFVLFDLFLTVLAVPSISRQHHSISTILSRSQVQSLSLSPSSVSCQMSIPLSLSFFSCTLNIK